MPNSNALGYANSGATVKAWCLTGFNLNPTVLGRNAFINGFNLQIDDAVMNTKVNTIGTSQQGISTGPIRFSFITPMRNAKYKVFLSPRTVSSTDAAGYSQNGRAFFSHVLNTSEYKKETTGFWVRFGILLRDGDASYISQITNAPAVGCILNRWQAAGTYQLQVLVI
jgi:hypothetical protein